MTRHLFILGLALLAGSCVTDPIPLGALNASVGTEDLPEPSTTCGNGIVEDGEACDDGQTDSCGDCNAHCTGPGSAPVCGDGDICVGVEACDDGFTDDCGSCNADCTGPGTGSTCGDGVICPQTEMCDDGNLDDCDACSNRCGLPGLSSGCATTNSTFDPNEVYLWGTLSEGACYRDAIAHWRTPDRYVVGFDCNADWHSAAIQPGQQRLLYTWSSGFDRQLFAFRCDGCPGWSVGDSYPTGVRQNDRLLPTPPCPNSVDTFLVGPDGQVLHRCNGDDTYYDAAGDTVYQGTRTIVQLGHGGLALATGGLGDYSVLDINTLIETQVAGLPMDQRVATRSTTPAGFWLVMDDALANPPTRWHIDADGVAVEEESYAADPPNHQGLLFSGVLDSLGNLFLRGRDTTAAFIIDVIIRYKADGSSSTVVYTEADDPTVKMHGSTLFTGP